MHTLLRALGPRLRGLARTPLFTVVILVTLALGIGATTAVFSVVHGVLLKPLPYPEPERLVGLWHEAPGLGFGELNQSPALHFTYRDESRLLEDSGTYDGGTAAVTRRGEPEQVDVMRVTDRVLPLLGVTPQRGRLFSAEDDSPGSAETVILSDDYWHRRLGGDPAVVGQSLTVDGTPREVIGVLAPDFRFLDETPDLYLPMRFDRAEVFFGNFSYRGLARLKPGVTLEQADEEVARMIPMALERFPMPAGFSREMVENARFGPALRPLKEDVVGDVGRVLWVLLGTVGIVLLVACANVANLLLVRAEGRRQELAVRSALGADRRRLGFEMLLESLLLGLAGGAAGVGLAAAGLQGLRALDPRGLPRLAEVGLEPAVLLFALGVSVVAALVFGALPLLRLDPGRLATSLKAEGRGASAGRERHLARSTLVAAQVALALVLLIGSGLMLRSFQALRSVDPGFRDPGAVLTLRLAVPESEAADTPEVEALYLEILRRIQELPGVTSAALSSSAPMSGWNSNDPIFVEDFPPAADAMPPIRRFWWVSPEALDTLGTPLVAGRNLTWTDVHDRRPVALVSEGFAREYWSDPSDALGRRIRPYPESAWREIVGVVGDVLDDGADEEAPEMVYWPLVVRDFFEPEASIHRDLALLVRSPRVGTAGFLDEVRSAVWAGNPNLPLARVRTLEEIVQRSTARTSFTLVLLAVAAGAALLLGAVGIYGVTAYSVAQRRREIGIRMALGARPVDVGRLVLGRGLVLAGIGAAVGLVAAVGLTRLMASLLFGVGALDPPTYAFGAAGVLSLAALASALPARRAAAIDPIETLQGR